MDESGFYKNNGGTLLYAPNFVYNKHYELLRESKDDYTYPVDGWQWFETQQQALDAYGIEGDGLVPSDGDRETRPRRGGQANRP